MPSGARAVGVVVARAAGGAGLAADVWRRDGRGVVAWTVRGASGGDIDAHRVGGGEFGRLVAGGRELRLGRLMGFVGGLLGSTRLLLSRFEGGAEGAGQERGEVDQLSDGTYAYAPQAGFSDTDGFVFSASDGVVSDSAAVLIDVGGVCPCGPTLSIDIIAPGYIVANDDDENDNGVVDSSDQEVANDDELVPVSISIANPEAIDLTGYMVEVGAFGAVALWLNQKGNAVPAGAQFPANAIPPMFVEGKWESVGQITARLLKPGGGMADLKDLPINVGEIRIRRDGQN